MSYAILLGFAVALSVFFFWVGGRRAIQRPAEVDDQLGRYLEDNPDSIMQGTSLARQREPGLTERVLVPSLRNFLNRLGNLTPRRNVELLARRLETAGRPYGLTVLNFLGIKFIAAVLFAALGALLFIFVLNQPPAVGVIFLFIFAILGFYLPELWLSSTIRTRQTKIVRALPDALDMIVVCTEAGQSFDQALRRLSEHWQNPLTEEFNRILAEIAFGRTRHEALSAAAQRIQLTEMSNLIATIIQADVLGVSIGKVLRVQADQLRTIRRQRAEELARQASLKMLFPLVFLIFPAMLAVLLGPAIPLIMETFGGI
jgi:tight adherence protein C